MKPTFEQVQAIRLASAQGLSRHRIVKKFGIGHPTVYRVLTGKSWSPGRDRRAAEKRALRQQERVRLEQLRQERAEARLNVRSERAKPREFDLDVGRAIYALVTSGEYRRTEIAVRFNVRPELVDAIATGPSWAWLRDLHRSAS